MSASTSSVAVTPIGAPSPQISPTSRPIFSGLLTPTPTRSNDGCFTISAITILPTKPVPHTTIRLLMSAAPLEATRVAIQRIPVDRNGQRPRERHGERRDDDLRANLTVAGRTVGHRPRTGHRQVVELV